MPIQQASYRGVRFDVVSVDDNLERATITHAYPFVNGGDIEDLGLNPLTIQLQAVFYGEGYYTDFKRFLSALEKQGAAVLVHPIRGRLQNMLCTSAYFHHEADFVDYVTVSLSFQEATPAKPIFLFNFSVLGLIDELLTKLEDLVDDVLELYGTFMEGISFAANVKSRLLGSFGALYGCFEQVRDMFDMDKKKHAISVNTPTSKEAFKQQGGNAVREMASMIRDGLTAIANRDDLTVRAKFDEVTRTVKSLLEIAPNLSNGKNSKSNTLKSLTSSLTAQDTKEIFCAVQLLATATVLKIATQFIEDDSLIPSEIDYIVTESRLQALATLNTVRALVQAEQNAMTLHYVKDDFGLMSLSAKKQTGARQLQTPNTELYTQAYNTAEKLRQQSHKLTQLALAAINRKPPLIIRTVEFDSTIQQVAHAFYGDYTRAGELLRLNPHIRYPNFIARGEVLNGYAK